MKISHLAVDNCPRGENIPLNSGGLRQAAGNSNHYSLPMKRFFIAAFAPLVVISSALAANIASDNASTTNYPGGAWTTGSNGGVGFGAWAITTNSSTGFAGSYIGGTALGGGPSFGIYSGNAGNATTVAYRPFTGGGLAAGQSFSVSLANTPTIVGEIGMSLMSGASPRWTLKFVGGGQNWLLNDGQNDFVSGQAYAANTPLTLNFTYNGGNSYSYTFGTGSGNNFSASADISNLNAVQFFSVNQGADQNRCK